MFCRRFNKLNQAVADPVSREALMTDVAGVASSQEGKRCVCLCRATVSTAPSIRSHNNVMFLELICDVRCSGRRL